MSEIRGFVVSRNGQRAKVKIDREKSTRKGLPTYMDCWNSIEATPGMIVEIEMQDLERDKAKMITYGIPAICGVAGLSFGRAMCSYFSFNPYVIMAVSTIIWLICGYVFGSNFKRDVAGRGEQPTITGYIEER